MGGKMKIKCVQHGMIINPSFGRLPGGEMVVYHHRHGSRCESQTFTLIEETTINRVTAEAWLARPRLQDPGARLTGDPSVS